MAPTPPANRLSTIVEKLEECARQTGSCAGFHAEFDLTEAAVGVLVLAADWARSLRKLGNKVTVAMVAT
jgi:hypothetical protein